MDRKVYLMRLPTSCPLNVAHEDCIFNEFRNAPIDKLITYTNGLTDQEVIT